MSHGDIEHSDKIRLLLDQFKDAIDDAKDAGLTINVTARDDMGVVISSLVVHIHREF